MRNKEMTFKIGGEAGQGVESSGAGFAKALARAGWHVFGMQDYYSRIRGGHNFYQIRVSDKPIYSHTEPVDLLLALTQEAVNRHCQEVVTGGGVICEECLEVDCEALDKRDVNYFPAPLTDIAQEQGGAEVMRNTAALGVAAGLIGFPFEVMASVIEDNFAKKGAKAVEGNLRVAEAAYRFAGDNYADRFDYELGRIEDAPPRMLVNGNEALALGALLGGCKFVAGYPMTPATSILQWMAGHGERYGVVVKHTEDEIAAILMLIGAAHMGARAMAPTSGGGFSLMTEGLGLAGITETPIVIVEAQRPGPATGLATRTEQGDLLFVMHASQGEFPRIILSPGTVEECFEAGWRAFNLAEMYQCPAIILSDNFLANSVRSIEMDALDFAGVEIDRGELLTDDDLDQLESEYLRFAYTESGVSPRALPGHPKAVYQATGNEHTPDGHLTEEPEARRMQVEKRLRKLDTALHEMDGPVQYGPPEADLTLVGWGSTYGPLRETVDRLNAEGTTANMLHIRDVWPFPTEKVKAALSDAGRTVMVEGNATGQMAFLLESHAGVKIDHHIRKYDGRPFSPEYILAELKEVENG
ncbi:MAG: pyruvate ferredoxin oxidoreductase [Chloroflexi bacterium B3_Chlor]|nr:MAG: pyruvate ferredoxin oxidoreductase [Chloroflexi bacterium B3_Chlor]